MLLGGVICDNEYVFEKAMKKSDEMSKRVRGGGKISSLVHGIE